MSWDFELVAGPYGGTTEGPVWDGEAVIFTHIPESRLMRYDPKSGEATEYFTGVNHVNGLCFDVSGNLFGCQQGGRRIVRFEREGKTITSLPHRLDGKRHNNPNDLVVDRSGRIWFTDPYSGIGDSGPQELDHMSVLRLDPTGDDQYELKRATTDISRPNGILISRDQKTLYVAQSDYGLDRLRELRAYPINDDGSLGEYETLHTFGVDHRGAQRGVDGMTLDTDGNIIACAGWETARPRAYDLRVLSRRKGAGDPSHPRRAGDQLLLRGRGPEDAVRHHGRRAPFPGADGPYRLDYVAVV